MDTLELMQSSQRGVMNSRVSCTAAAAAETGSQTSCPALIHESQDVHQFLTLHAVNGGIVDLLTAYVTQLSQRCHLTW